MESKEEDAVSTPARKLERKPAKQVIPGKLSILWLRILAMHQNTSTKGSLYSSESKDMDVLSTTASKTERKPAKQADPR
jgi:hypothetical protein